MFYEQRTITIGVRHMMEWLSEQRLSEGTLAKAICDAAEKEKNGSVIEVTHGFGTAKKGRDHYIAEYLRGCIGIEGVTELVAVEKFHDTTSRPNRDSYRVTFTVEAFTTEEYETMLREQGLDAFPARTRWMIQHILSELGRDEVPAENKPAPPAPAREIVLGPGPSVPIPPQSFSMGFTVLGPRVSGAELLRPKVFRDGDKWCALYGENIMEGISGFGNTAAEAVAEFEHNYFSETAVPMVSCPDCNGAGEFRCFDGVKPGEEAPGDVELCRSCRGTGQVPDPEKGPGRPSAADELRAAVCEAAAPLARKTVIGHNIRSAGYDPALRIMDVEHFAPASGDFAVYRYFDVGPDVWESLRTNVNQGYLFSCSSRYLRMP